MKDAKTKLDNERAKGNDALKSTTKLVEDVVNKLGDNPFARLIKDKLGPIESKLNEVLKSNEQTRKEA